MKKSDAGERTLLASVVMSSPGPLVTGMALLFGRSSTQLADFIRRTAELAAILVSWLVFRRVHRFGELAAERQGHLERLANLSVGGAMCLSGIVLLFVAVLSPETEKGNVIPGLVIALLGVTTNSWFWLRYRRLHQEKPDAILAAQSRLYLAKFVVDAGVTLSLLFIAAAPDAAVTRYVDLGGSIMVAGYLLLTGSAVLRGRNAVIIEKDH